MQPRDRRYIDDRLQAASSNPDQIVATEMRRDSRELPKNDNFAVILDTFLDHRSGFFFYVSAAGGMFHAVTAAHPFARSIDS